MLDYLKSFFKKEFQLSNISVITGYLSDIMELLNMEYMNDTNLKDEAIDAIIKLLEEQKTVDDHDITKS